MSAFHPTFVSHAHVDNDLCDRYAAALRTRGIDTWYDRNDAKAGHFLGTDIQRELQQRTAFVLLITQPSLDSWWVQLELQAYLGLMSQDRSRILLPVRIGPCQVPPLLNALFWIDAQAMPFDQAIDAISAALTVQDAASAPKPVTAPPPPRDTLPPLGPSLAPANSTSALHLTPMPLVNLGFRGYTISGVECILPPICPVPAGDFTMGSDKTRDRQAYDNETPQYRVEVGSFVIGQHPVTVAEYGCAVRAKAVREPSQLLGGMDWARQQVHLDHPVVCVSWNDARAYVTWLAKVTAQPWQLPSEAEWEKAARGTDERIYPWGNEFERERCNTDASGIGVTVPIGSYPGGESPYHVHDMAGNVREWTSSLYRPYPYRKDDGRENLDAPGNRVRRGGSWYNTNRIARAAYRGYHRPTSLTSSRLGFRLLLAAHGS
ncbi:MAG TPA: SUMF1/EgtB/PvdO family nonheme iron enzyme [Ktedonobacteraceae bacterium]|nr:SUMF1/EgtB/PvdO family nonheme iron enzyme [Ktedonobacteraceae bacterium]